MLLWTESLKLWFYFVMVDRFIGIQIEVFYIFHIVLVQKEKRTHIGRNPTGHKVSELWFVWVWGLVGALAPGQMGVLSRAQMLGVMALSPSWFPSDTHQRFMQVMETKKSARI